MSYAFSVDEEHFSGDFDTVELACQEAARDPDIGCFFWVGEVTAPPGPEAFFDADLWLEHVSCQDEYSLDCAEDWDQATAVQKEELEEAVRNVMSLWLDRHNLRPGFFMVSQPQKFRVMPDGKWEQA